MSLPLVPGANAALPQTRVNVRVECGSAGVVTCAVAVLPLSTGATPWLPLQGSVPPYIVENRSGTDFCIDLEAFSPETEAVLLVLYATASSTTLKPLQNVRAEIGPHSVPVSSDELMVSCLVFAEVYRRGGAWKVRAKNEGVFDGIEELGRRMGLSITDERKNDRSPGASGEGEKHWGGSGSLVADRYLVTNAHVVENAKDILVSGFFGKSAAEPVIVDDRNDLALLRLADSFGPSPLAFRSSGVILGEKAITMGYPLQGVLGSGPQLTDGSVSNLLGPQNDVRLMQVSCPIQPGSSGGPVFDCSGLLIGVITGSLRDSQNVNFAIRTGLVLPLLEAVDLPITVKDRSQGIELSDIARAMSRLVWRVECSG